MNLRRRKVSDSPQTIRRRSSPLTSDESMLNIPIDLVMEIFSRLPLKSIARCRCVSKRWASVLLLPDFTELFFTRSSSRPKLLFACRKTDKKEVRFFSTPYPQILGENASVTAARDHHVSFSFERVNDICSSVNGFFCISDDRITSEDELVWVICNPSTGQSFTLPKVKKTRKGTEMRRFLGFDPVEKLYKVLSVTVLDDKSVVDHQVVTLGTGNNMTWRSIECDIPHSSPGKACKCINGVIYYFAWASGVCDDMIVCFDVRSEKFSFVKPVGKGLLFETLINFQGKLAVVRTSKIYFVSGTSTSFEMWILQDSEKHEWSKCILNLPPLWEDAASRQILCFVGVTDTNEFVFKPFCSSDPFYLHYYNFVDKTVTRVEIQGMGAFEKASGVRIFLNHVDNVKLM